MKKFLSLVAFLLFFVVTTSCGVDSDEVPVLEEQENITGPDPVKMETEEEEEEDPSDPIVGSGD